MIRVYLCLAIIAVELVAGQQACSRPPQEVAGSPVPPLKRKSQRESTRAGLRAEGATHKGAMLSTRRVASMPAWHDNRRLRSASLKRRDGANIDVDRVIAPDYQAAELSSQQSSTWNSPEMLEARQFVKEFCRRSARTSPSEGAEFLEQLSQLAPLEMRHWLERFQTRRRHVLHGRELEGWTRQVGVQQAISRLEAMRRAAANTAILRSQAAAASEQSLPGQQLYPATPRSHKGAVLNGLAQDYDPLEAVVDPSSPRGYGRRVAAAMSLPGDLPSNDPRNFIRGDVGADFGEWATHRGAQPSVAASLPAPSLPQFAAPTTSAPAGPVPIAIGGP